MFEELQKSNLVTLLALGLLSAALPKLLPNMRPGVKEALKVGLALVTESASEAEAEVIDAAVSKLVETINGELAKPQSPEERRAAVTAHVQAFKHQARRRARRWASDDADHHRRYRRHMRRLAHAVESAKAEAAPANRPLLGDIHQDIEESAQAAS